MNPLTNIRSRQKQREQEVIHGIPESASYHSDYRSSAYIYAGQLSFNLTEGDLLAIFSQFGEIIDVNLVRFVSVPDAFDGIGLPDGVAHGLETGYQYERICRDKNTRKSRGFAFLAYEDQRSSDLAVDNLNGITVDGRIISVDHVKDYKRLVANPDYVDTRVQQNIDSTATAQVHQVQQSSDRILSGAEAEDVEDELGTSGIPDICRQAGSSSHVAGARGPHRGGSGSSIAEMLREVEAYVGNWRSRGTNGAVAQQCATGVDVEDPMADYKAHTTPHKGDGKSKRRRKHKEKKDKPEKMSTHAYRYQFRSRSRSPRPSHRDADSSHDM